MRTAEQKIITGGGSYVVQIIEQHGGVLPKVMVIFRNAERALRCVIAMQQVIARYYRDRESSERVLLCAGIGFG